MQRKIDLIKAKKEANDQKKIAFIEVDQSEVVESNKAVASKLDELYEMLNDKKEFDPELFAEQIEQLSKSLDISQQIKELIQITKSNRPEKVEEITVKDLTDVIKAIKENKPIVNVDFGKLEKAIIEVQQRVQDGSVPNQAPDEFTPTRRVVKIGNRLVYDDQPTSRGGSGGSATVDTSALATSAK